MKDMKLVRWELQQREKELIANYFEIRSVNGDVEPILREIGENNRRLVASIRSEMPKCPPRLLRRQP